MILKCCGLVLWCATKARWRLIASFALVYKQTTKPYKLTKRLIKNNFMGTGSKVVRSGFVSFCKPIRDVESSLLGLLFISLAVRTFISSLFVVSFLAGLARFCDLKSWHLNVTMKCLATKEIFKQDRQKFLSAAWLLLSLGWPVFPVLSLLLCFSKWRRLPF